MNCKVDSLGRKQGLWIFYTVDGGIHSKEWFIDDKQVNENEYIEYYDMQLKTMLNERINSLNSIIQVLENL
jgi:hypothetical protein